MARNSSRSRSRSPSRADTRSKPEPTAADDENLQGTAPSAKMLQSKGSRRYRVRGEAHIQTKPALPDLAALEEEMAARVEAEVAKRVAEALESPEVQARLEARLREERAKLEEKVTRQLEEERAILLDKRRREHEEAVKRQQDLEKILQENQRKLDEAQRRAAEREAAKTAEMERVQRNQQGLRLIE